MIPGPHPEEPEEALQHGASARPRLPTAEGAPSPQSAARQAQQRAARPSHALEVETAFARNQAEQWALLDIWIGAVSLTILLLLPANLRNDAWGMQPAAVAALLEVMALAMPGLLAWSLHSWYLPRRTAIIVVLRLANWGVMSYAAAPPAPSPPLPGWPPWPAFVALTRCISLNVYAWCTRMPFKVFLAMHMVGVAEAARVALSFVCGSPSLGGCMSEGQLMAAGRVADVLARLLDPMGNKDSSGSGIGDESLTCMQWELFLLATVGAGFPIACQYLTHVAARQSFVRRFCRRTSCRTCSSAKSVDFAMLLATAVLLFVGYCAASWHLIASLVRLLPCSGGHGQGT